MRQDWAAALTSTRPHAAPNLAIFRCTAQPLPFALQLLERHPHSTQAFLPLACANYLIAVAPCLPATLQAPPDLSQVRAFLCGPGQGINYNAGVWHHPIVALNGPAEFAMLAWEDGTAGDCEEYPLPTPLWVHPADSSPPAP
jgi:ureidoglycolate lyase